MDKYLYGQRVIVYGNEIGVVVKPETNEQRAADGVWVRLSSNNYASCYSPGNVKTLPGGQL